MNPLPELTASLKQLRLSGILDTLETRNREAIDRKLAYTDFLTLLIQDEIARRDHRKLDARMRRANFRSQKTLEGFDFDRLPNLNRAVVHDLATSRFIDEKVCVLIAGPCGTGKSHLAQALGHAAARQGHDVLFMTQTRLLSTLRSAQAVGSYERRFQALAKVPLLIVDDFGLKPLRSPEDEDFHDLIAERYASQKALIHSKAPQARDFTNQRTRRNGEVNEVARRKNRNKSKIRARVEHMFAVVKRLWGFTKVRYRGLAKNANRAFVALALANVYLCRTRLMAQVCP